MFKALFYFFGIFGIVYEIWCIKNYPKSKTLQDRITSVTQIPRDLRTEAENDFLIKGCFYVVFHILYLFWAFVGLFSSQWFIFLMMLVLGLISSIKSLKENATWNITDSLISIGLILFAVLNTYHFHVDIFGAIIGFFID